MSYLNGRTMRPRRRDSDGFIRWLWLCTNAKRATAYQARVQAHNGDFTSRVGKPELKRIVIAKAEDPEWIVLADPSVASAITFDETASMDNYAPETLARIREMRAKHRVGLRVEG
jgi:hypothetical protein